MFDIKIGSINYKIIHWLEVCDCHWYKFGTYKLITSNKQIRDLRKWIILMGKLFFVQRV